MKYLKTILMSLIVCFGTAQASIINDPWHTGDQERNLYDIYNSIYGTNYINSNDITQITPDEIFNLTNTPGTVLALSRYSENGERFGIYQPPSGNANDITYTEIFDVENPSYGDISSLYPSFTINVNGAFGFYNYSGGVYWYSNQTFNDGHEDHMITLATADPNVFLLCFEDLPFSLSDMDYNDMVVELNISKNGVVPEPASLSILGIGLAIAISKKIKQKVF